MYVSQDLSQSLFRGCGKEVLSIRSLRLSMNNNGNNY